MQTRFRENRTAKLCFYADNQQFGYKNRLFCFDTNSPEYIDYMLYKFLHAGNVIRVAYINFSDKSVITVKKGELDELARSESLRTMFTYTTPPIPFC